ncbi:MAG: ABC transporter ATP-binding protein [Candidatus Thiodiazotropha sp.]|jgi:ABC-2 type transport system ATP-binding protein
MSDSQDTAMIQVRELVFDYPAKRALHSVSFDIQPGRITALVGPNGAGKSTLLRCLAALSRPFSGSVRIHGFDTLAQPRKVHHCLGYLSDFFGLYDQLSVRRCLLHACRTHGVSDAQVEPTAECLNLTPYLHIPAGDLSRGLRQRLAIGQSIIHQPAVLLLDEPASGLDPEARASLSTLFLELRDQGMTLLVSSHILAELADYASEVLIIESGRILDQQVIAHADHAEQIRIELSREDDRLVAFLATQEGCQLLESTPLRARISLSSDANERVRLLSALVTKGLPVAAFVPERPDLQQLYVKRIQAGRQQ